MAVIKPLFLLSLIALTYFSQALAFPSETDQKLYDQADKFLKSVDKSLDVSHLPAEEDHKKVVESGQTIVNKASSYVYDQFKDVIDELSGDKPEDVSPYQFLKQTREYIREKLKPVQKELNKPHKKEEVVNKIQHGFKRLADNIYETVKEAEQKSNHEEKKKIKVYEEIVEELKKKDVQLQDKIDKLDQLYVNILKGVTEDLENGINETKNQIVY